MSFEIFTKKKTGLDTFRTRQHITWRNMLQTQPGPLTNTLPANTNSHYHTLLRLEESEPAAVSDLLLSNLPKEGKQLSFATQHFKFIHFKTNVKPASKHTPQITENVLLCVSANYSIQFKNKFLPNRALKGFLIM